MTHRVLARSLTLGLFASTLSAFPARGDEVSGKIKSVDAPAHTFVVASGAGDAEKTVELKIDDNTVAENAKGKAKKRLKLESLNVGGNVTATFDRARGVASKVVLDKGSVKKKDKKKA